VTAHRAARRGWRSVGGAAVAVVVVAAGIAVINVLGGHPLTHVASASTSRTAGSRAAANRVSPSASASRSAGASSGATSPAASAGASAGAPAAVPTQPALPAVVVLNDSRITGLAHRAAAVLAARGWSIALIGNLPADVSESTVYYAAGAQRAARKLLGAGLGVRRLLPQVSWPIAWAGPLVVVLTNDSTLG